MSSGIDKLKKIGVQKIHENTHISRAHIEAIFQENFEDMHNSVQLNGFLSILERDYGIDLSDLRLKVKDHFEHVSKYAQIQASTTNLFLVDNRKKKLTFFYIALGVVVFILFAYLSTNIVEDELAIKDENVKVETTTQNNNLPSLVEENLTTVDENSTTLDHNETEVEEIVEVIQEKPEEKIKEPVQEKAQEKAQETLKEETKEVAQKKVSLESEAKGSALKITPKSKVWIGYIDLSTGKKYQTVSSDELVLDSAKGWLLSFGHGNLDIEANGKLNKYQTVKNLRFIYKNGELKELSVDEFKELNSGKLW